MAEELISVHFEKEQVLEARDEHCALDLLAFEHRHLLDGAVVEVDRFEFAFASGVVELLADWVGDWTAHAVELRRVVDVFEFSASADPALEDTVWTFKKNGAATLDEVGFARSVSRAQLDRHFNRQLTFFE